MNHLTHELEDVDNELTHAVTTVLDTMLREYTAEERMFFAMLYARQRYERVERDKYDITDYRIAADETANAAETQEE